MTSLSLPSNCFPCNSQKSSSSYNVLNTSAQSALLTSTLPSRSLPYLPPWLPTTGTNSGLLSIPWPQQARRHPTFLTVIVPSNQNSLFPDTQVAPSSLRTMPSSQWQPSVQFSSVAQSCPTLCNPMDYSTPSFPVLHQLPELAQTCVHQVSDADQPFHPLSSPTPPAFNLSQYRGLFTVSQFLASGGQTIGASASVLPMTIQDWFPLESLLTTLQTTPCPTHTP